MEKIPFLVPRVKPKYYPQQIRFYGRIDKRQREGCAEYIT